jgi:rifampicin phosphotransferase
MPSPLDTGPLIPLAAVRRSDAPLVGAKAATLGALADAGFPVPAGLCLTTTAFQEALAPYAVAVAACLDASDLRDPGAAAAAADQIAALLAGLTLPAMVDAALAAALAAGDLPAGAPLAVRSSATAEDQPDASYAGQYATVLGARGLAALRDAIGVCWRSFFSAQALAARAAAGALTGDAGMGVLIQPVVDAECAGVCFSVDPVAGVAGQAVVEAAWGLGLGVVDGDVSAMTARVRRDGAVVDRRVPEQAAQWALAAGGGTERVAVPAERRRVACLPDAWLARVAEFGVAAELALGAPQDVEWAIAGGQIWILQSRPLTGLPPALRARPPFPVAWGRPEDRRLYWRLSQAAGAAMPRPLENDYYDASGAGREEGEQLTGIDERVRRMVVNGRRYITDAPPALGPGDRRQRAGAVAALNMRLLQEDGRTAWDVWGPEVEAATARLRAFDPAPADAGALADHLEDAFGAARRHWAIHWLLGPPPLERYLAAYTALTGRSDPAAVEDALRLTAGADTPLTRLVDALHALAVTARATPRVAALVADPPADVAARLEALPEAAEFRAALAAFLWEYGDRSGAGLGAATTFATLTWREDPAAALAAAAPYLDPAVEPPARTRARAAAAREAEVAALCAACADPAIVAEFERQRALAQRDAAVLEIHNHYIDQMAVGQTRAAIAAVGRRLAASGALADADDVYWLRRAEIPAALAGAFPVAATIAARRAEHAAWATLDPPPFLGAPPAALPPRPVEEAAPVGQPRAAGPGVRGMGASPGRARGRARFVAPETQRPALNPGDILVAENAGPLWTPIFPILGGIVLDGGAIAMHAIATAREYGIPAVVATGDATRRIRDGAWITVDGAAGTVEPDPEE